MLELVATSSPPASVALPSILSPVPNGPSSRNAPFWIATAPPLLSVRLLRMVRGLWVPPWASNSVLVAPAGALMSRLLRVSVVGNDAAVVASLVTVLVPALVIRTSACPM